MLSGSFDCFLQDFVKAAYKPDFNLQSSQCCHVMCKASACTCVVYLGTQAEGIQYNPPNASWPNPDIIRTMPFDYTIHDPKYDDISTVYCPGYKPGADGRHGQSNTDSDTQANILTHNSLPCALTNFDQISDVSIEIEVYCAVVLNCLCPCCHHQETLCGRRMYTYVGGHLGSSCLNMQHTTPITTVNSVTSTWASTPDTRSATHKPTM